jgi:hypothetical protein
LDIDGFFFILIKKRGDNGQGQNVYQSYLTKCDSYIRGGGWGLMSYQRYLCLLAYTGVQHILCCVFALLVFCLVYHMLPVSLDCLDIEIKLKNITHSVYIEIESFIIRYAIAIYLQELRIKLSLLRRF